MKESLKGKRLEIKLIVKQRTLIEFTKVDFDNLCSLHLAHQKQQFMERPMSSSEQTQDDEKEEANLCINSTDIDLLQYNMIPLRDLLEFSNC